MAGAMNWWKGCSFAWLEVGRRLAIEVASPLQHRLDLGAKAQRYLSGGTRLVWIIYPQYQQVDVWRSGARTPSSTLDVADTLDGEDVVPGFRYSLADLFG